MATNVESPGLLVNGRKVIAMETNTAIANRRKSVAMSPWWIDYGRQQYQPQETISIEKILRMSFITVLKEYVKNCSVAGVKQMTNSNISLKRRCLWGMVFLSLLGLVCYFLIFTWVITMANPLILMPQFSTYSIADIDYPAVAFCNVNRISWKAVKELALVIHKHKYLGNASIADLEEFLRHSGRLVDFNYFEAWTPSLLELEHQLLHYDYHRFLNTMKKLTPDCKEMLLRCSWAGEITDDCMALFKVRRTARGHCCVFNYILEFDEKGHPNRSLQAKRQALPGYNHGLNIIIDPLIEDYAYPLNVAPGFEVMIFEPTHYADPSTGRVVHRLAEPDRLEFLEIKAIVQTATAEVRKYPLSTRKCMFHDENSEDFHNLYSYSACITRCRIRAIQALCQCTPYYLPKATHEGLFCQLSDLRCLNKHREKLYNLHPSHATVAFDDVELGDSLYCSECLPDCEHTRRIAKSSKTSINMFSIDKYFTYGFLEGVNVTGKCVLSIYYSNPGGDLERLDVVTYWYQIVSNFGGFGGVLIGMSLFTFVEIVYFFFIRYFQEVFKNYIEYH